jgi:hypothetical protein
LQNPASLGFSRRRATVLAAVEFYDQPGLVAHKVGNVAADRHLAAELAPLTCRERHILPRLPFRLGHVLA